MDQIHKNIEVFFEQTQGEARLFYERRPGQYAASSAEKVRIITKENLLKYFASMFIEEPNRVGRYYKDLLPLIGKQIFSNKHEMYPYYTAAFSGYKLEQMFRAKRVDARYKNFRYQILMAIRLVIEKRHCLDSKSKLSRSYCEKIDAVLLDTEEATKLLAEITQLIDKVVSEHDGEYSLRVAKMKDTRDRMRELIDS